MEFLGCSVLYWSKMGSVSRVDLEAVGNCIWSSLSLDHWRGQSIVTVNSKCTVNSVGKRNFTYAINQGLICKS